MAPPPPSPLSFYVRRCKPELLTPAKPTPRELKQLSDIDDQQGHRCHIRIIMFYKNRIKETEHHHHHHVDPVSVIREAMAKALVLYYPLAGRLIEEPNTELTMDCTGEGILLVQADANVNLDQQDVFAGAVHCKFFVRLFDKPSSKRVVKHKCFSHCLSASTSSTTSSGHHVPMLRSFCMMSLALVGSRNALCCWYR
ncbi:hypothetical protein ACSBR1_037820 [Camellia fascicularis]